MKGFNSIGYASGNANDAERNRILNEQNANQLLIAQMNNDELKRNNNLDFVKGLAYVNSAGSKASVWNPSVGDQPTWQQQLENMHNFTPDKIMAQSQTTTKPTAFGSSILDNSEEVPSASAGMFTGGGSIQGPAGNDQVPASMPDGSPARLEKDEFVLPKEVVYQAGAKALSQAVEAMTGKKPEAEMKPALPGQKAGLVPGMEAGSSLENPAESQASGYGYGAFDTRRPKPLPPSPPRRMPQMMESWSSDDTPPPIAAGPEKTGPAAVVAAKKEYLPSDTDVPTEQEALGTALAGGENIKKIDAAGTPVYKNVLDNPKDIAEYGKAIYSDSLRGATKQGLDEDIKKYGEGVNGTRFASRNGMDWSNRLLSGDSLASMSAEGRSAQPAMNRLKEIEAVKNWMAEPDVRTRGHVGEVGSNFQGITSDGFTKKAEMPDWVADDRGVPRRGESNMDMQVRKMIDTEMQPAQGPNLKDIERMARIRRMMGGGNNTGQQKFDAAQYKDAIQQIPGFAWDQSGALNEQMVQQFLALGYPLDKVRIAAMRDWDINKDKYTTKQSRPDDQQTLFNQRAASVAHILGADK